MAQYNFVSYSGNIENIRLSKTPCFPRNEACFAEYYVSTVTDLLITHLQAFEEDSTVLRSLRNRFRLLMDIESI